MENKSDKYYEKRGLLDNSSDEEDDIEGGN